MGYVVGLLDGLNLGYEEHISCLAGGYRSAGKHCRKWSFLQVGTDGSSITVVTSGC